MEKEIIINNKLNETGRISQFMEELGVSLNIPSEIAMSMNLAIEEIIANIITPIRKENQAKFSFRHISLPEG